MVVALIMIHVRQTQAVVAAVNWYLSLYKLTVHIWQLLCLELIM